MISFTFTSKLSNIITLEFQLVNLTDNHEGVYEKTGSAAGGMIVWAVAGLISTLCTLAYAELGMELKLILLSVTVSICASVTLCLCRFVFVCITSLILI